MSELLAQNVENQDSQLLEQLYNQLNGYLKDGTFSLSANALGSSAIESLIDQFTSDHELALEEATLSLSTSAITVSGKFALTAELEVEATARFTLEDKEVALELEAQLAPGQTLGLKMLMAQFASGLSFPAEIPDLGLVALTFNSSPLAASFTFGSGMGGWTIPVGQNGLTVQDVKLSLTRTNASETEPAKTSATISGGISIAGAIFEIEYTPPGDLIISGHTPSVRLAMLLNELCGTNVLGQLSIPQGFIDLTLPEVTILLDVARQRLSLSAHTEIFDAIGLTVGKDDAGKWGFSAGLVPVKNWRLSQVSDSLKALDTLSFDEIALVVSSVSDGSLALPALLTERTDLEVLQGLNFFATLSLTGLGADKLLGIEQLGVHAAIGTSLESFVLEAEIAGHIKLADNVMLKDIKFRLHPAPTAFEVTLLGDVAVVLEGSPLDFIGGVSVTPTGASFAATMLGDWNNPFGVHGVAINGLALELGIAFDDGLPIIGLAGGMTIGSVHGKAAVRFDSGNPSLALVAVEFDSLNLGDVVTDLCASTIPGMIPADSAHTILNITFRQAKFYVVPQTTHIGEIIYKQGLAIVARMNFWGFEADGQVEIDYENGIIIDGSLDPIVISDVFRFTGAQGEAKPNVHLEVGPSKFPQLNLSGLAALLGISAETKITLSDSGFYFFVDGKIYDLFECRLEAQGGHLDNADAFMVKAMLKNDLFEYLREEATKAIDSAAKDAASSISAAQKDVDAAQAQVNSLNGQIDTMRRTVQAERQAAQQKVASAQQDVTNAQNKVNDLNNQLNAMRHTVQVERDNAQQKVAGAQQDVNNAQNRVNDLNNQIANTRATILAERASAQRQVDAAQAKVNDAQNSVNSIQGQIDSLNHWYYSLPKTDWPWKDSQATRAIDFAARQAAFYTALGTATGALKAAQGILDAAKRSLNVAPVESDPRMVGLYTALGTATGALKAAQAVLDAARRAIVVTPVDADPRVAGLIVARDSANAGLVVARQVLAAAQAAIVTFPVDADPRVAGLIAARETATVALKAANGTLEGVKVTVGGALSASEYIAKFGLGGVLDVKAASFEASLSVAKGGSIMMSADVVYLGQAQSLAFGFNFNDPVAGARNLANKLLGK
jgi:peptidoglycan hydrolase CwlO-like protein